MTVHCTCTLAYHNPTSTSLCPKFVRLFSSVQVRKSTKDDLRCVVVIKASSTSNFALQDKFIGLFDVECGEDQVSPNFCIALYWLKLHFQGIVEDT